MSRPRPPKHILGLSLALLLMALLAFNNSGRALADDCGTSTCQITFTGQSAPTVAFGTGSNGANAPTLNASASTLNGLNDTLTVTLPMVVTDGTGTASGWNVTLSANSAFTHVVNETGPNTGHTQTYTLPITDSNPLFASSYATGSCTSGSTCTLPTATSGTCATSENSQINYHSSNFVPAASDGANYNSMVLFDTDEDTTDEATVNGTGGTAGHAQIYCGVGEMSLTPTFTVTLPADQLFAYTYSDTLTLSITQGP
jgi:hypothetical protein